MSKGIELPINVLVIVSVAVIVLLGIIALFMTTFGQGSAQIQTDTAWNRGCSKITANCYGSLSENSLDFSSGLTVPLDGFEDGIVEENYYDKYENTFLGLCLYNGKSKDFILSVDSDGDENWETYTKTDAVRDCVVSCGCNL